MYAHLTRLESFGWLEDLRVWGAGPTGMFRVPAGFYAHPTRLQGFGQLQDFQFRWLAPLVYLGCRQVSVHTHHDLEVLPVPRL